MSGTPRPSLDTRRSSFPESERQFQSPETREGSHGFNWREASPREGSTSGIKRRRLVSDLAEFKETQRDGWTSTQPTVSMARESYRSAAVSWLVRGAFIGAILAMVLGPAGFVAGGLVGGLLTLSFGLIADALTWKIERRRADANLRRLEQLLRWTNFVFAEAEQQNAVFVYLCQEMRGAVLFQERSRTANALLKRFRDFLERLDVQDCVADIVFQYFEHWREADDEETALIGSIVSTVGGAFRGQRRVPFVYTKIQALLQRPDVLRLFSLAEEKAPKGFGEPNTDWMIFADLREENVQKLFRYQFNQKFHLPKPFMKGRRDHRRLLSAESMRAEPDTSERAAEIMPPPTAPILSMASQTSLALSERETGQTTAQESIDRKKSLDVRAAVLEDIEFEQLEEIPAPPARIARHPFKKSLSIAGFGARSGSRHATIQMPMGVPHPFMPMDSFPRPTVIPSIGEEPTIRGGGGGRRVRALTEKVEGLPSIEAAAIPSLPKPGRVSMPIPTYGKRPSREEGRPRALTEKYLDTVAIPVSPSRAESLVAGGLAEELGVGEGIPETAVQAEKREVAGEAAPEAFASPVSPTSVSPSKSPKTQRFEPEAKPPALPVSPRLRYSVGPSRKEGLPPSAPPYAPPAAMPAGRAADIAAAAEAPVPPVTTPEKRFFKDLADLQNFEPDLKHKIPIGLYEFDFLRAVQPEDTQDKSWDLAVKKGGLRIYKKIVPIGDSDLVMVKGYCAMDGVPAEWILYNIRETNRRKIWDKTFDRFTLVEDSLHDNEIVYNMIPAPWPVVNRDILQWRRTVILPNNTIMILHRSAEHPAFPEDKTGAMIRAESIISGYVIKPRGPNDSDLFLVAQTDIRGSIPRFVVNATAARAPVGWVENLRKACQESMQKTVRVPVYEPRPKFHGGVKV